MYYYFLLRLCWMENGICRGVSSARLKSTAPKNNKAEEWVVLKRLLAFWSGKNEPDHQNPIFTEALLSNPSPWNLKKLLFLFLAFFLTYHTNPKPSRSSRVQSIVISKLSADVVPTFMPLYSLILLKQQPVEQFLCLKPSVQQQLPLLSKSHRLLVPFWSKIRISWIILCNFIQAALWC